MITSQIKPIFPCLAVFLLLVGCTWMKPVSERMDEARTKERDAVTAAYERYSTGSNEKISLRWRNGVEKMYMENPNLIRADYRVEDAKQRSKDIWKNLIPSLSLGASDSQTLENFDKIFTDPSLRINSYLSLGSLLTYPKRIYENKLYLLGAELQAEQSMRQEVIKLYRLFQKKQLLDIEKRAISYQGEIVRVIPKDTTKALTLFTQYEKDLESWKEREKDWRTEVGDFYMSRFGQVNLDYGTLPDITYEVSELDLKNSKRWGMLQINLLALQRIAEQGRILEAYSRYLPDFNLGVSAPPIYNNNSGQGFDPNLVRLSPSANWRLDTQGSIGRQVERLWREDPLKQWDNDRRRDEEVARLVDGKNALAEVKEDLATVRQATAAYRKLVKDGLVTDFEKAMQTMRGLREKELALRAKEIEISTSFWLIDESRWVALTKRWRMARKVRLERLEKQIDKREKGFLRSLLPGGDKKDKKKG